MGGLGLRLLLRIVLVSALRRVCRPGASSLTSQLPDGSLPRRRRDREEHIFSSANLHGLLLLASHKKQREGSGEYGADVVGFACDAASSFGLHLNVRSKPVLVSQARFDGTDTWARSRLGLTARRKRSRTGDQSPPLRTGPSSNISCDLSASSHAGPRCESSLFCTPGCSSLLACRRMSRRVT